MTTIPGATVTCARARPCTSRSSHWRRPSRATTTRRGRAPTRTSRRAIRHAIEAQTFTPRRGDAGVHLVDAVAARFGEFDHVHVVGLVETDWPERTRRSIFYTAGLLKSLGWPQQPDHTRVQQAVFVDLLGLPARTLTLHAFQLECDSIVAPSPLVELARDVNAAPVPRPAPRRLFDDEVLTGRTIPARRRRRTPRPRGSRFASSGRISTLPRYGGFVGRAAAAALSRQPRRSLRGLSVQVLRRERAGAARRTRRDGGPHAARARQPDPRAVRAVLSRVGRGARRQHHGRDAAGRGRAVRRAHRRRCWRVCPRPIACSSARACSAHSSRQASPSACSRWKPTRAARSSGVSSRSS